VRLTKKFSTLMIRSIIIITLSLTTIVGASAAQPGLSQFAALQNTALPNEFEYPELNVTPRASDRIDQEAAQEHGRRWSRHAPIIFSGLMTFSAGLVQYTNVDLTQDPDKNSPIPAVLAGGAWLGVMSYLATSYNPYSTASKELAGMPKKTVREQLSRERYAEAQIAEAASLAKKLRWLSVLSNAGVSIYLTTKVNTGTVAHAMDLIALGASFTPLVFRNYWERVGNEQADYKKRIYAPVASTGFTAEPMTGAPSPTFFLSLFF